MILLKISELITHGLLYQSSEPPAHMLCTHVWVLIVLRRELQVLQQQK